MASSRVADRAVPSEVARQASRAPPRLPPPRSNGLVLVRERSTPPHDRGVENLRRQSAARGTASLSRRPGARRRDPAEHAAEQLTQRVRVRRGLRRRPSRRRRGAPGAASMDPADREEKSVERRGRGVTALPPATHRCCRIARRTRRSRARDSSSRHTQRSSRCTLMAAGGRTALRFSTRAEGTIIHPSRARSRPDLDQQRAAWSALNSWARDARTRAWRSASALAAAVGSSRPGRRTRGTCMRPSGTLSRVLVSVDALSGKLELHRAVRHAGAPSGIALEHAGTLATGVARDGAADHLNNVAFTATAIWAMRSQVRADHSTIVAPPPRRRRRRARQLRPRRPQLPPAGVATQTELLYLNSSIGGLAAARWPDGADPPPARPADATASGPPAPRTFPRASRSRTTWHTSGSPRGKAEPTARRARAARFSATTPTPRLPPSTSRAASSSGARRSR